MRRFVSLAVLLLFSVPIGVSLSGCHKAAAPTYCNGAQSGVQVGQLVKLDLEPRLTGISLNQGEIGQTGTPSGTDCQGNTASPGNVQYGSSNINLVDIVPNTGRLCAGTWNRNTGAGIADYTVCTAGTVSGVSYVTASSGGVSSNPIPVFVHPVVTNIVLGQDTANCTTDPASDCFNTLSSANAVTSGTVCATGAPVNAAPAFTGNTCISQGSSSQLVARVYANNSTSAANNISCLVGPLTFSLQTSAVGTIQTDGVVTAAAPGSSIINATAGNSQASSSAGFFSTCPPASIVLTTSGATTPPTAPITINQNITQNLTVNVLDLYNQPITNITLGYESTNPIAIPAITNAITPTFPGSAAITAICQPGTCNPSAYDQIGLFGNGNPIFSNPLQVNANGTGNSTVLYIASTQSQYILPIDFTAPTTATALRLPYTPNSMVMSQDLSTIYLGSSYELMELSTGSNSIVKQDPTVSGTVLSVSPSSGTVVITDPVRSLIYLYSSSGSIMAEYGGVATSATWTPDSSSVYITTTDGRLLVYSTFTGWNVVALPTIASSTAVTIPSAGVYVGNSFNTTSGAAQGNVTARTNCPITSLVGTGTAVQTTNVFYPQADSTTATASSIAATTDGQHIFGVSPTTAGNVGGFTDIVTNTKSGGCQLTAAPTPAPTNTAATLTFSSTTLPAIPFTGGVTPTYSPTGALASPAVLTTSDSAFGFVIYQGTGGAVPQYNPATKTLTNIPLQKTSAGTPIAPIAGAVSTDNQTLYVGSTGDNLVHLLTRGTSGFADTTTPINPQLTPITGTGYAVPNLIVLKPRKNTN
jgi:hypothetical protein